MMKRKIEIGDKVCVKYPGFIGIGFAGEVTDKIGRFYEIEYTDWEPDEDGEYKTKADWFPRRKLI